MRRRAKPGFLLVATREWRWLLHDRVALVLIFGVPLFAFVVLTAVFSQPVIRGLGVVVVDADRSDTSRALIEQVAVSPNLRTLYARPKSASLPRSAANAVSSIADNSATTSPVRTRAPGSTLMAASCIRRAGARAARCCEGLARKRLCRRSRRTGGLARGRDRQSESAVRLCASAIDPHEHAREDR
jgi:hypothetical protein